MYIHKPVTGGREGKKKYKERILAPLLYNASGRMVWHQLAINKPHLVYIIWGGFTSLFMLCSLVIKEKLYIGEATVATLVGVIFGPHAANLINPFSWGNTDQVTLEFSRIVLVVQCFAVGVELPRSYMERHWKSVFFLLVPVMACGWLATSVFIWWMIEPLTWLESFVCAACVTATDPVLASSVVGKGKFAKRVPKHLRDVLSAESGCNDGMAFPFIYLSLYLLRYQPDTSQVMLHWTCYTILYECVFGAFYGFMIGFAARHLIKFSEQKGLIDRESFLVFYFTLALFCAGSGSMLGMDDLLIGFSAGVGFSNDGWFQEKTEESHVSNVIDLLLNLAYFVYFGTIVPWDQYNTPSVGLTPWRLTVIAVFVILFRRIPIMLILKPIIPDVKTWREALFAGHFGPIGVGAIFAAILARAELETGETEPLAVLPPPGTKDYELIFLIWPVVTFLVISSIIVHGSSIAVFTLGRRINTLTLTFTYTQDAEAGGWMNRLPRISSQSRSMSKQSFETLEKPEIAADGLLPTAIPRNFLRRQREEDAEKAGSRSSSLRPYRRRKKRDSGERPGGPVSQSAIAPQRRSEPSLVPPESGSDTLNDKSEEPSPHHRQHAFAAGWTAESSSRTSPERGASPRPSTRRRSTDPGRSVDIDAYEEGDDLILEDAEGNVLKTVHTVGLTLQEKEAMIRHEARKLASEASGEPANHAGEPPSTTGGEEKGHEVGEAAKQPESVFRKRREKWRWGRNRPRKDGGDAESPERKRGPAHAYQFGNTIIVEDEDGEVIKKYTIPDSTKPGKPTSAGAESSAEGWHRYSKPAEVKRNLHRMGTWVGIGGSNEPDDAGENAAADAPAKGPGGPEASGPPKKQELDPRGRQSTDGTDDGTDDGLRMTISHAERYGLTGRRRDDAAMPPTGRRLSTKDFIRQLQMLDSKTKIETVEESDAPDRVKEGLKVPVREEDEEDGTGRRRAGTVPSSRPPARHSESSPWTPRRPDPAHRAATQIPTGSSSAGKRAGPYRTATGDTLDSPGDEEGAAVPTVDMAATLARHGRGSTAADSRRRLLAAGQSTGDGDGEDDDPEGETAAERRRRLAALGLIPKPDEESSSEDDDTPRRPREQRGQEPASPSRPRVQWGGERGREGGRETGAAEEGRKHGGPRSIFGRTGR